MLFDETEIENRHRSYLEEPIGLQLLGTIGLCTNLIVKNSLTLNNVSQNELVCSSLGIRIRISLGASVKLAGAGYFSAASSQLRDIAETSQLLEYFSCDPQAISEWVNLSGRSRYEKYGFTKIRKILLGNYNVVSRWEERFYFHSEYGTHPSVGGALAIHSAGSWQTSPHFDEEKFKGIFLDIANDACMAVRSYIAGMDAVSHASIANKFPEEVRIFTMAEDSIRNLYLRST